MPLPEKLEKLTAAAWRDAKKEAGVKGAGFFDGRSGRAVADKIADYHAKAALYEAKRDKSSGDDALKALNALSAAFTAAKKDRDFSGAAADLFKKSIDRLIVDIEKTETGIGNLQAIDKKRQEEKAGEPSSSGNIALSELNKITKFSDVMGSKTFSKEFIKWSKANYMEESINFILAVAKKVDRQKIIEQFITCPEKDRINIPTAHAEDILAGGDLRAAVKEVSGMLDGRVIDFKEFMRKSLKK